MKRNARFPSELSSAWPTLYPSVESVSMPLGSSKSPGRSTSATSPASRRTTTARDPSGVRSRSVASLARATSRTARVSRFTARIPLTPGCRSSAIFPSGVICTSAGLGSCSGSRSKLTVGTMAGVLPTPGRDLRSPAGSVPRLSPLQNGQAAKQGAGQGPPPALCGNIHASIMVLFQSDDPGDRDPGHACHGLGGDGPMDARPRVERGWRKRAR